MIYFVYFLITFFLIYFFYLFTVVLQPKKYEKFKKSNQVLFFVKKYKINVNKLNMKKFTNLLGITNALIVAIAFMFTFLVKNILLQFLIGFLVIMPLILIFYNILGKYLKRKCK